MANLNRLPFFLFSVIFVKNEKKASPCCSLDFINESKLELHMKHSHMHNYRKVKTEESTTDLVNGRRGKSGQNMLLKYSAFGRKEQHNRCSLLKIFNSLKKSVNINRA